jgi:gas vesicle protein
MNERTYYSREAEMRANREKALVVFLFLALGIGIGAALALLFAPKSGEQVRGDLAGAFEEGFDSGREATMSAIQRLEKGVADLTKKVEERLGERK